MFCLTDFYSLATYAHLNQQAVVNEAFRTLHWANCEINRISVTDRGFLRLRGANPKGQSADLFNNYYRPQTKFEKVMFLHLSVSHSVHRGSPTQGVSRLKMEGWGVLQAHTWGGVSRPTSRGRRGIPACRPPSRRLLLRAVSILRECIFVLQCLSKNARKWEKFSFFAINNSDPTDLKLNFNLSINAQVILEICTSIKTGIYCFKRSNHINISSAYNSLEILETFLILLLE